MAGMQLVSETRSSPRIESRALGEGEEGRERGREGGREGGRKGERERERERERWKSISTKSLVIVGIHSKPQEGCGFDTSMLFASRLVVHCSTGE